MTLMPAPELIVERDLVLLTEDGVRLVADVYRPAVDHPVPCVLSRTPYDKRRDVTVMAGLDPVRAARAGLAVVCQDVRGRFASEGTFEPFRHERSDGAATLRWLADQPWCSGRIGMAGRSYAAATQWLAASTEPPALAAICPVVGASDPYEGAAYQGGAFQLGANLFWAHLIMSAGRSRGEVHKAYRRLPLRDLEMFHGTPADFYYQWLDHPERDDFWTGIGLDRRYPTTDIAVLNVSGWFDPFLRGTLDNFAAMSERKGRQRLLIGPWGHGAAWGSYPDHTLPDTPGSGIDLTAIMIDFFCEHLIPESGIATAPAAPKAAGETPGPCEPDTGPVELYLMGGGQWIREARWPPPAIAQRWYLHSGGQLSTRPPGDEEPDVYRYDPADPAPTVGGPSMIPGTVLGSSFGPLDRAPLECRSDVLVYTSAALESPLEVVGPLNAVLYAATSAADTDFVVALCVVDERGVSRVLAEGIRRARYRFGAGRSARVRPDRVMCIEIDLVATSVVIQQGQRLRVTITSSSFPRFDRNLNTGGPIGQEGLDQAKIATQTILHDYRHPAHISLPVRNPSVPS